MTSVPDVSIIIVNLNTRGLLEACLNSVDAEGKSVPLEVIVVDNGSTDGSVEMIRSLFPAVHLTVNERNEGFARPNNAGLRQALGRHLFLLNSDTEIRPGALRAMIQFLDNHSRAGACGPRLVYPDGRTQRSVKGFPGRVTHLSDMLFLDRLFPHFFGKGEQRNFDYFRAASVDHVMAAAFMIRRQAYEEVGPLDEEFAIYYNDMDWCYRAKAAGWEIWYLPDPVVIHYLGKTVGALNREFAFFDMLYHNVMLFYQKHYGRSAVVVYRLLLIVGFSMRACGWSVIAMVKPSEDARHMRQFSWKSLLLGLKFWEPACVKGP
jgi:hypothetical protein